MHCDYISMYHAWLFVCIDSAHNLYSIQGVYHGHLFVHTAL